MRAPISWMRARHAGVAVLTIALIPPSSFARTILVPSAEAPTIQAGLTASVAGDSVVVACGTYLEHSLAMKSGVTLRSENGLPSCVTVDAQNAGQVMVCLSASASTRIEGLTFTRGRSIMYGGGVRISGGSPTFLKCAFVQNVAFWRGGGAQTNGSNATFLECSFSDNVGRMGAGGLLAVGGSVRVEGCVFDSNDAGSTDGSSDGGAIACLGGDPVIEDCVFQSNLAHRGGGVLFDLAGTPDLRRCRFESNVAHEGGGVVVRGCDPSFEECVFRDNQASGLSGLGRGGALFCDGAGTTEVLRCDFVGGTAARGSVAASWTDHQLNISRSIAFQNGAGIFSRDNSGAIDATCSDFYDNGGTSGLEELDAEFAFANFTADPAFCDAAAGDFGIRANSQCAAANSPCGEVVGAFDPVCEARGIYLATRSRGLAVVGDGLETKADAWFDWNVGTQHEVSVPTPQLPSEGVRYDFSSWSDGGSATHLIQVGSPNDVLTADFDSLFFLETIAMSHGTVSPESGWRTPGEVVPIAAVADAGWAFHQWVGEGLGSFSGDDPETTVTMHRPIRQVAEFIPLITFTTEPPGVVVRIDDVPHPSPVVIPWTPGLSLSVEVDSLVTVAPGHRLRFMNWSTGATRQDIVFDLTAPAVITATFATEYTLSFEPTDDAQLLPGDMWVGDRVGVTIEAVPEYGRVLQTWIGTGEGSYTGPDNPSRVTMYGPIHQQATFGPAFVGTGYEFSISASDTDPFMNAVASSGTPRLIYLWLTCSQQGLSAMEFGVNATLPVLGFEPEANVLNVGTATNLQLAIGGCPAGDPAATRLGRWLIDDTGGTFCVGPSEGAVFGAVDCHPIDAQLWPDPRVTGFASDGSLPCIAGTNVCTDPPPTAVVVTTPSIPLSTMLHGAYPNPVVGPAQVRFSVAESRHVRLSMYDVAGRLVEHLVDAPYPAGEHGVSWNPHRGGRQLPDGIYFLRLESAGESWSKKMVLVTPR